MKMHDAMTQVYPEALNILELEGLSRTNGLNEEEKSKLKSLYEELRELTKDINIKYVFSNGIDMYDVDKCISINIEAGDNDTKIQVIENLKKDAKEEGKELCIVTNLKSREGKVALMGGTPIGVKALEKVKFAEEFLIEPELGVKGYTDNETWKNPRKNTGIAKSRRNARKRSRK